MDPPVLFSQHCWACTSMPSFWTNYGKPTQVLYWPRKHLTQGAISLACFNILFEMLFIKIFSVICYFNINVSNLEVIGYIYLEWMIILHLLNAKAWTMILEFFFRFMENTFSLLIVFWKTEPYFDLCKMRNKIQTLFVVVVLRVVYDHS